MVCRPTTGIFPKFVAREARRKPRPRLAELLSSTLDNAPSDWARQNVQQAIADVRAFAERAADDQSPLKADLRFSN